MKRLSVLTSISIALVSLLWVALAYAALVNELGTLGAPISITTATKILNENGLRRGWCVLAEGTDIRCNVGTAANGAPTRTPSTTIGFLFKANALSCVNLGPTENRVDMSPTQRVDCASTSGAVSVDTWTW